MATLPSGQIHLSNVNTEFYTVSSQRSLASAELRYLGTTTNSFNNSTFTNSGQIGMSNLRGKPSPDTGFVTYTTAGSYTVWSPVYKNFKFEMKGAGGGQGGSGYQYPSSTFVCCCTFCPYACCFCYCYNYANSSGQATGSAGGLSNVRIVTASVSDVEVGQTTGGSGGVAWPTSTAGGNGTATLRAPYTYGYSATSGGSLGGSGSGSGGAGGRGGNILLTYNHATGTGAHVWANTSGVTKFTILVGQGGQGGSGATTPASFTTGASGTSGNITLSYT